MKFILLTLKYIIIISIFHPTLTSSSLNIKIKNFEYQVMCPISSDPVSKTIIKQFNLQETVQKTANLYVVLAIAKDKIVNGYDPKTNQYVNKTTNGLYYCGLARPRNGLCSNAQFICSSPAPTFRVPTKQETTIIWINNISSKGIVWEQTDCYSQFSDDMQCTVDAKIKYFKNQKQQKCPYFSPTHLRTKTNKFRINLENQKPMAPHIHGLEIGSRADGNPYSWFTKGGNVGIGYQSEDQNQYFHKEQKPNNVKIMKFKTNPLPGMLFYHDHAMKVTKYNVLHGLMGIFIIYDINAEKQLPKQNQENIILFSVANDGDLRKTPFSTLSSINQTNQTAIMNPKYQQDLYILSKDTFYRNMTYRFRFLNAHFDNYYDEISFAIYYNTIILPNGTKIIQQIDPFQPGFDLTSYATLLNFTVIGTDATLFDKPIHNISQVTIGSGQRIDLLIKFSKQYGVPQKIKNYYLICYDKNFGDYTIKKKFALSPMIKNNKYHDPILTKPLDIAFTDLTKIPQPQKIKKRMRMFGSLPGDKLFSINNHYMYHDGQPQNPKIGTIEDFFFINVLFQPHPIHFHLVNYQIIQTYELKRMPQPYGCTLYQLDNYRFSKYPKFGNLTDEQLCNFTKEITIQQAKDLYSFMANYSLQNEFKSTDIGQISGLNVLEKIINPKDKINHQLQYPDCQYSYIYKYICKNTTQQIKPYHKRWKQTALIKEYTATVLRVRWTSTGYNHQIRPYPYFDFPEDEIIKFPGYLYHCHILPHEDNEMMRSFMIQPSDHYIHSIDSINYIKFITEKDDKIKFRPFDGWKHTYQQTTSHLKCQT